LSGTTYHAVAIEEYYYAPGKVKKPEGGDSTNPGLSKILKTIDPPDQYTEDSEYTEKHNTKFHQILE